MTTPATIEMMAEGIEASVSSEVRSVLIRRHLPRRERGELDGNGVSCDTEEGSYWRLIDSCITQLKAQGPSRTCNESKEEVTA